MPRAADARAALAATLALASLVGQLAIGRATRDALFLSAFDADVLPAALMGAAALSILSVLVFSRLLASHSPARVVPAAIGVSQLSLLAAWSLSFGAPRVSALVVYAHMAVFGGALVSGSWSLVNERFDARTGKRLVGWITTGGLLGAVFGALLAWGAAQVLAVPTILLLMVAIDVPALGGVIVVARSTAAPPPETRPRASGAFSGFRTLRETPYLRGLAVVVGLSALTEALLDYVLSAAAQDSFATGPELMSFFALFYLGVSAVGLLLQLTVAGRALASGLVRSLSLKPWSVLLGGTLGAFVPGLWMAAALRGVPGALHNSIYRSGYELLYTPLPERQKRPVKALIDVGADKLGAFLGGGLALVAVALLPDLASPALCLVAAAGAGAVLLWCRSLQSGYVETLEANLRSRAVLLEPSSLRDSLTRLTVARVSGSSVELEAEPPGDLELDAPLLRRIAALRSGSTRRARAALAEQLEASLIPHVLRLLESDELAPDAVAALRPVAASATGQLCDALLDPSSPPAVRRRVPRALKACPTQRAVDGLIQGLRDDRFEVRYECGAALARIVARQAETRVAAEAIYDVVVRELAPEKLSDRLEKHIFNLLSVVLPREPLRLCYWALREESRVRGTALEYLEQTLPPHVGAALLAQLEGPGGERTASLDRREEPRRSQEDRLRELSEASSASGVVAVAAGAEEGEDTDPDATSEEASR